MAKYHTENILTLALRAIIKVSKLLIYNNNGKNDGEWAPLSWIASEIGRCRQWDAIAPLLKKFGRLLQRPILL